MRTQCKHQLENGHFIFDSCGSAVLLIQNFGGQHKLSWKSRVLLCILLRGDIKLEMPLLFSLFSLSMISVELNNVLDRIIKRKYANKIVAVLLMKWLWPKVVLRFATIDAEWLVSGLIVSGHLLIAILCVLINNGSLTLIFISYIAPLFLSALWFWSVVTVGCYYNRTYIYI